MDDNPYLDLIAEPSAPEESRPPANPYVGLLSEEGQDRSRQAGAILNAADRDPDARARALSLAKDTGLPADTVERNQPMVEREAKMKRLRAALDDAPALAKLMEEDPEFLTLAQDDVDSLSFMQGLGNSFKRGVIGLRQGGSATALGANARVLTNIDSIERRLRSGNRPEDIPDIEDTLGVRWMSEDERGALKADLRKAVVGGASDVADRERESRALPMDPDVQAAMQADSFGEFWDAFRRKPLTFIAQVGAESLPQMAPGLVLGAVGGVAAGAPLAAAGAGAGSYGVDYAASVLGALRSEGVNVADREALAKAVQDEALMERVGRKANAHATVVSVFDAASMGVAGKTIAPARMGAVAREGTNIAAQTTAQGAMGAAGEAVGTVASGEEVKAGEVAAEFFGEFVGAPAEVATAAAGGFRSRAETDAAQLDQMAKAARTSKLLTRQKESFERFVQEAAGEDAAVYIPAEKAAVLFQSLEAGRAITIMEDLGVTDQFGPALESGGDIVVPLSKYLSTVAPDEQLHAAMLPSLRTDAGGLSLSELEEVNAEARAAIEQAAEEEAAFAEAEKAAMEPAQKVGDDVRSQLRATGRYGKDAIDQMAAVMEAFFGRTYGDRAFEQYQRWGVQIVGEMPQAIAGRDVDQMDFLIDRVRSGKQPKAEVGDSLLEFIAKRGGVEDAGGELKARDLDRWHKGKSFRKKLVRESADRSPNLPGVGRGERGNFSLEEVARAAADAGYLPDLKRIMEDPEAPAPDFINTLLEAIDRELGGAPVYAETAVNPQTEAERQAVEELARLLDQMGIDLADDATTNQMVKDALAALSSGETQPTTVVDAAERAVELLNQLNPQLGGRLRIEVLSSDEMAQRPANEDTGLEGMGETVAGHNGSTITITERTPLSALMEEVRHMIDMLLGGWQVSKWLDEDSAIREKVVAFLQERKQAGDLAPGARFTDGREIAQALLDQYFRNPDLLAEAVPEMFQFLEAMDAGKYRAVIEALSSEQAGDGALYQDAIYVDGVPLSQLPPDVQRVAVAVANGRDPAKEVERLEASLATWQARLDKAPSNEKAQQEVRLLTRDLDAMRQLVGKTVERRADQPQEAVLNTESAAFKRWFKNSKVVDSKGEPLVVYHGTQERLGEPADIEAFDPDRIGDTFGADERGFFFISDPKQASGYATSDAQGMPADGGAVYPSYVALQKPLVIDDAFLRSEGMAPIGQTEDVISFWDNYQSQILEWVDERKSDGVILVDNTYRPNGEPTKMVVAFRPEQIKSVFNRGTFDPNDPRILYQGGAVEEVFRGESDGNKGGNYYTPDREFARNFTQSGRDAEIKKRYVRSADIYEASPLPFAGDVAAVDAAIEKAREGGFKAIRVDEGAGQPSSIFVFDDSALFRSRLGAERGSLAQRADNTTRGSIEFGEKTIIRLFQSADLSTALHEFGHLFLRVMQRAVAEGDGPETLAADYQTIKAWLGKTDDGAFTVEQEEQWARGFEAYLREGKAPSLALQSAFSRFKAWLMSIYKSLTALRVEITPEIRGVMDRMLASEDEIAAAEAAMRYRSPFKDAKQAGMTEAQFAAYTEKAARASEAAKADMLKQLLAEESRARESWWKDERAKTRSEVETEVNRRPVYAATLFLTNGEWALPGEAPMPMKLDRAALVQMHGEEMLKYLPRSKGWAYAKEGGVHPDIVAPLFGYPSGDAMLKEMWQAPKRSEVIEAETDARMFERHGDMLNDGTAQEAALEASHNDDRGLVLLAELKAMRSAAVQGERAARAEERFVAREVVRSVEVSPETYRQIARTILGRKLVKDATSPVTFQRAEVRAAAATEKAIAKGDYIEAARQKERQILNFYLWSEARKAQQEVEKAQVTFARFNKPDEKLTKSLDVDYLYAIRWVLARYGIGRPDPRFDFGTWRNNLQAEDPDSFDRIALAVDTASGTARPWKQLTLDEFRGLTDAVDNLRTVGRSTRKIDLDGQKVDLDTAIADLTNQAAPFLRDRAGGDRGLTPKERTGLKFLGALASLSRVEAWARMMDGGTMGAFTRILVRPVMGAVAKYRDAKADTLGKLLAILEPRKAELMSSGSIAAPEIGYTFANKGELLAAILHTGNESNMERLLLARRRNAAAWGKVRPDGSLDTTRWNALIARLANEGRLTKEDFDTAQAVWDLLETTKPAAQKAHREMYGYYFSEITARPVQTPFGTYRGGYVPAIVDRDLTSDGARRNAQDALSEQGTAAMFPSTGRGFTKSRVQNYHQPLDLNLLLLPSHIDKVLRFTHLNPTIRGLGRIAINRDFVATMENAAPHALDSMILPWLNRVGRQTVETPSLTTGGQFFSGIARFVRKATGLQIMAGNLLNALQQITGLFPAATRVPPAALMRSLVEFRKNPETTRAGISEKSAFMRQRMDNSANELMGNIEDVLGEPGLLNDMRRFGMKHGYILQQIMQNYVDVVVWRAAYEQAVKRGASDADAVYDADSIVRTTQGSLAPEDISNFEAGPAWARLFTMFVSYFNTQANLLFSEGRTALKAGDKHRLFALYFFGVFAPAVAADMIVRTFKGEWDDEDDGFGDDLAETFALAQARYMVAMIPGAGPFLTAGLNKAFTGKVFDDHVSISPIVSTAERAMGAPGAIYKAIAEDGKPSRAIKDTAVLIGLALGLPLGQPARPIGYVADVATGNND